MKFFSEKLQNFLESFFISDNLSTLVELDMHKLVDLVFSFHIFYEFSLQMIDFIFSRLVISFTEIGVVGLKKG